MRTPIQADRMMIHNGTISGFGSGIGTAVIFTSCAFNGFSSGSPIYGNRATRDMTIVDKFNGTFGASCKNMNNYYKLVIGNVLDFRKKNIDHTKFTVCVTNRILNAIQALLSVSSCLVVHLIKAHLLRLHVNRFFNSESLKSGKSRRTRG